MTDGILVKKAELGHVQGIVDLQKRALLKNKTIRAAEKEGFIIYPISEDELRGIISSDCCFLIVALQNDKVVGYSSAYDLNVWKKIKSKWDKRSLLTSAVRNHLIADKVLYLRHIVRDPEFKGVGEKLEDEILSIAKSRGYKFVVAEILESPLLNKKSKEFHEKYGYIKIGHVDYFDGNFWGLYEKKID